MRTALAFLSIALLGLSVALGGDGDSAKGKAKAVPVAPIRKSTTNPSPTITPEIEAGALAFVREHHPELASVLETLKPMDPAEYRKAIGELSQVARTLAEVRTRNPKRYEVALDAWKAKSRVELIAAQLAGAPSEELRSQLRSAIEAKIDSEIRRQRFDLEQAEAVAKKARETLDRLENHRDAVVEARFRALQPKKKPRARRSDEKQLDPALGSPATATKTKGENRP